MYFKNMIEDYEMFRKILCNEYPYILVDEYQDTNKNVIESLERLIVYTKDNHINFCIGYYGDEMQANLQTFIDQTLKKYPSLKADDINIMINLHIKKSPLTLRRKT